MEYIYCEKLNEEATELNEEIIELSKENIQDLINERDKKAYEVLMALKNIHKKLDELVYERDSILSELPDEKVKKIRKLIDKTYDCMKEKNKLQKELFGLDENYHLKINKQIDLLERYGLSVKEFKDKVTASKELNVCNCNDCKIKFKTDNEHIENCPYCGSKNLTFTKFSE